MAAAAPRVLTESPGRPGRIDVAGVVTSTGGIALLVYGLSKAATGLFGLFFFLTLFIQTVLGYSAIRSGITYLLFAVGVVIGSALACDAVRDLVGDSRRASPGVARLYNDAIARGKDHPYAVRILARAWLCVIWHCWHHGVAYYPARHKALQRASSPNKTGGRLT